MFNFFKKRKPVIPPFDKLQASPIKDCYFYRVAQWHRLSDGNILAIDPNAPRIVTFDPWPQLIFLEADGKRTVTEFVAYLASSYEKEVPLELDDTVLTTIDNVLKTGLIQLSTIPIQLDPKILKPSDNNIIDKLK
ncbi:hypothetical protein [Chitinophaga filiformis]|uniref:Coenzyme PQQ synthesis protein D (PqqD) n=1 Tax=Chitinophaga filiformis TaxID=104663 RepID=A0ABY4HXF9_CHIFI|nr:hypothetical protein [Chitinophaga filiformis]UPK68495.1 hypothetical protein MYF79_26420 [Chitinophaga filiformis]